MQLFNLDKFGQDILTEASLGWYLTQKLEEYGLDIEYRPDGTTPINIINSFSWVDDPDRYNIVRKKDYKNPQTQIPLPIVSYGFLDDMPSFFELGSRNQIISMTLAIIVAAETALQSKNIANFIRNLLSVNTVPIYNYNETDTFPHIGVISCEDFISTRFFEYFNEPNIATKFSIGITCSAKASFKTTTIV